MPVVRVDPAYRGKRTLGSKPDKSKARVTGPQMHAWQPRQVRDLIELAEYQDGRYVGGVHFAYSDDQLRSMPAAWGEVSAGTAACARIPTTSVLPERLDQTRRSLSALAIRLLTTAGETARRSAAASMRATW
jgi:hypothetical protein